MPGVSGRLAEVDERDRGDAREPPGAVAVSGRRYRVRHGGSEARAGAWPRAGRKASGRLAVRYPRANWRARPTCRARSLSAPAESPTPPYNSARKFAPVTSVRRRKGGTPRAATAAHIIAGPRCDRRLTATLGGRGDQRELLLEVGAGAASHSGVSPDITRSRIPCRSRGIGRRIGMRPVPKLSWRFLCAMRRRRARRPIAAQPRRPSRVAASPD